jgi:hypothetical protein
MYNYNVNLQITKENNLIIPECKSEQELIEKLSTTPDNLINFFEVVCNNNNRELLEDHTLDIILKKFTYLQIKQLINKDQNKKITEIITNTYPYLNKNISDKTEIKTDLIKFYESSAGIKIKEENDNLVIDITTPIQGMSPDEISSYISDLQKIYSNKNFKLNLRPQGMNQQDVTKYIQNLGPLIETLDLESLLLFLDNDIMPEIIKNCPSINHLTIAMPLNDKVLENLSKLNHLQTLQLRDESLASSSLKLTSLPSLPNLKSLVCSCPNLQNLPPLPNVQTLKLFDCDVQNLPPLPNVQTLELIRCASLQNLPPLPNSLQILSIRTCPSLQNLPALPNILK